MYRLTLRDSVCLSILAVVLVCWLCDHFMASARERQLRATQADLAAAVQKHTELVESMTQWLNEYENQYVLIRRFLRVAKQTRE